MAGYMIHYWVDGFMNNMSAPQMDLAFAAALEKRLFDETWTCSSI